MQTQDDLQLWKLGHTFTKNATIISAVNQTSYERLDGIIATAGSGSCPHEGNRSESFKVVVGQSKPQTKSLPCVKCGGQEKTDVHKTYLFEACCGKGNKNKLVEQDENTFV